MGWAGHADYTVTVVLERWQPGVTVVVGFGRIGFTLADEQPAEQTADYAVVDADDHAVRLRLAPQGHGEVQVRVHSEDLEAAIGASADDRGLAAAGVLVSCQGSFPPAAPPPPPSPPTPPPPPP